MYSRQIDTAIECRREWLRSLKNGSPHALVHPRWNAFRGAVHNTKMSMAEFEEYLKIEHPNVYHEVDGVKGVVNG